MVGQFTKTTKRGYGSRLMGAIKGIFIGFLLFIISFGVLYWNEGRVDKSRVAETAIEISATEEASSDADGELISATGEFTSEETIGDTYLRSGSYIAISRNVEMYAWVESTDSETDTNLGGSETTTTTYRYDKEWTSSPQSSGSFEYSEGHENPTLDIEEATAKVSSATLGMYAIDVASVSLPGSESLTLTDDNVVESGFFERIDSKYLYDGFSYSEPDVGDIRISYDVVRSVSEATIFGTLNKSNSEINSYSGKDITLYRIFEGNRVDAIGTMATEHTTITWILRLVGFLMMWIGLNMIFAPLSVLLDVLPIFGRVTRKVVSGITFVVSLILSVITILISMFLHSLLAVIIVAVAAIGVVAYFFIQNKDKLKKGPGEPTPETPQQ